MEENDGMMGKSDGLFMEAMQAFAQSMEEGGPDMPKYLLDKKQAYEKARDDYLSADANFFFYWGYLVGKASAGSENR